MINIQRTRPLGITIIAVIVAIYGVLGIIGGFLLLNASVSLAVIGLILGVLELVLAWGLWSLQSWAFWATAIVEVLAVLNGIFAITQGSVASGVVDLVIALVVLIYLFADPNVRPAFRT